MVAGLQKAEIQSGDRSHAGWKGDRRRIFKMIEKLFGRLLGRVVEPPVLPVIRRVSRQMIHRSECDPGWNRIAHGQRFSAKMRQSRRAPVFPSHEIPALFSVSPVFQRAGLADKRDRLKWP